ncbi:MAG: hypothetical protein Q8M29_07315 [Bacteroidota bacterium]|nr:hypothetical protein [Bacteroidota bacterium]
MATKKESEATPVNSNVNNNTNNINLNVKVEHPKVPRKPKVVEKKKPNWVVKALVVGIIGLVASLITYYVTNDKNNHKPAIIERKQIERDK